ncbi:MAG: hypothetical protein LKK13_03180 [Bacilli bacterium]|jgi:FtsZ-interacting cell division protein ZipA|nr:hypothetical protein [Bacilli bacterium]
MKDVILSAFYEQPWFIIVMLLAVFGLIVFAVIMVKRYAPAFKSDEKPKSDKEIAEEEVNRMVRPVEDEETARQMEESAKEPHKEAKAVSADRKDDAVERAVRPVEDEEAVKQMAKYAETHPEEEASAAEKAAKKEDE